MAYFPKNKAKIKSSKDGEFIYQDDRTPFKGTYIKTSKGQYFEGENINSKISKIEEHYHAEARDDNSWIFKNSDGIKINCIYEMG